MMINETVVSSILSDYYETDDHNRVREFAYWLDIANQLEDGDYIEVGTLWGISLGVIHKLMDPTKTLYSFDTFDGFDIRDLNAERMILPDHYWQPGSSETPAQDHNFFPTSVELVRGRLGNPVNIKFIEGWFPETFAGYENHTWRFAHIDVDLFQPTFAALQAVWPKLVPGGIIIVHDYGVNVFAAHNAVDVFCQRQGVDFQQLSDKHISVAIRKR